MKLNNADLLPEKNPIDGAWVVADSGQRLTVKNAATGAAIAGVPLLGQAETQRAIAAAEVAQRAWKRRSAAERAQVLHRWVRLIEENREDLASLMTAEGGKPLAEARGEVGYAASFITWFAEEAKRIDGALLQPVNPTQRYIVSKQPVGVCAAITPWNFPAAMITRKAAPALAAGCAIIVKPAEQTPLTALALAKLGEEAGLPPGVLQVLTGDAQAIGGELCRNPTVRKLSFTGSTETGRLLMAQCAPTIKKLSLELGGNAPVIVFDDADLQLAVSGIMASKFRNSGQTCVCANRIYVQRGIYPALADALVNAVQALKVGNGMEEKVTQGPLIDQRAVEKVEQHIRDALEKGATLLTGGQRHPLGGNFFTPTVIGNVNQAMRFAREETFGPVAPLIPFDTDEEVVGYANDTEFGLAAYLFTRDARRQWLIPEALEYGMVGVNTGLISNEVAPFGGIKQSGLGREGSRFGIDDYLELKYICIAL
ncbi:NAD-dependent succinate-semialdehyde dehydrogenase [Mixta tenebrionis]|uniref:NAD-dependent succinate-semialdehyde dehydrogenase n=1 Tax=Mixta tenebrionis TaxID=2562439 RepID=A0A506VBP5_9GAMM|nr:MULTISPECIES: NAD-dependent succinate-semialdehyde dehydrogenase [Mixta]QHM75513.1 Glutarate-semialdehyde dehydrogenase DavD [Mixta theicola]TPW43391.1 NAD-dependent succinate-semialdehyde dehydrogenase [Mixta tenebrionis]